MRFLILFLTLGWYGCNSTPFSKTSHGVHYKIAEFTNDSLQINSNSVIVVEGQWSSSRFVFSDTLEVNTLNSATQELLIGLCERDSIYVNEGGQLLYDFGGYSIANNIVEFRIKEVTTLNQMQFMTNYPILSRQLSKTELAQIVELLSPYSQDSIHYFEGMFIISQVKGSGLPITLGSNLTVNFTPLNMHDAALRQIVFELGKPDQVVKGFELGLQQMHSNGKAVFIIPSKLAFGTTGTVSGTIKPNQPVAFQVHVLAAD